MADIESIKAKYEDRLLQLANVTAVGIGEKDGKQVIKVYVTRKLPESALRPKDVVPRVLEGYETDVEETGVVHAQTPRNNT